MIGAIAGDIIGSIYERHRIKTKDFPLFGRGCRFTDDSVLTVALADSILNNEGYAGLLRQYYRRYPHAGYGSMFRAWALQKDSGPYNSFGNGAAMRISPVGFAFDTLDEVMEKAREYTAVTHNHPEGIKGAQATAAAVFLARTGSSRQEMRHHVATVFGYDLDRTLEKIRPGYGFDVTCQGSVPEAIISFLESADYEDAVRNAISLGGDSDTLACITGGIAQAFYGGVPGFITQQAMDLLDRGLRAVVEAFARRYPSPSGQLPE